jgi:hypothetical protein
LGSFERSDFEHIVDYWKCFAEPRDIRVEVDTILRTKACLVFIILRKAPTDVSRVATCALPVQASVTVITGHEKPKKSSKDAKRWPHERSYLK